LPTPKTPIVLMSIVSSKFNDVLGTYGKIPNHIYVLYSI
jgi:hypothetical protein